MEKETVIRPSLLSGDFSHLGKDVEEAISYGIASLHFDVMDGTFVEDISFGEPVFKNLMSNYGSQIDFDVHLMVVDPLKQLRRFASLGAKEVAIHFEALHQEDYESLAAIRKEFPDLKIGLAFNPSTSVADIKLRLPLFDYVLVMSVVPGKGGQSFLDGSDRKTKELADYRKENNLSYLIGVDGGINDFTGPICYASGVDYLVAGSYYFKAKDRKKTLKFLSGKLVR